MSGRGRRHALAQHPAEPLHTQFALVVAVGAVVVELVVVTKQTQVLERTLQSIGFALFSAIRTL